MKFDILKPDELDKLKYIIQDYKKSIHEETLQENQFIELKNAILDKRISFYVVTEDEKIIGMCSISTVFSTFRCEYMGIFEDFYVIPDHRKKGVASSLVDYVFRDMKAKNINTVWVGSSDNYVEMYKHLGFDIELGNLLTWNGV